MILPNAVTYDFGHFAALPEGLDGEGVHGALHGDGVHLDHAVVLTAHGHMDVSARYMQSKHWNCG